MPKQVTLGSKRSINWIRSFWWRRKWSKLELGLHCEKTRFWEWPLGSIRRMARTTNKEQLVADDLSIVGQKWIRSASLGFDFSMRPLVLVHIGRVGCIRLPDFLWSSQDWCLCGRRWLHIILNIEHMKPTKHASWIPATAFVRRMAPISNEANSWVAHCRRKIWKMA